MTHFAPNPDSDEPETISTGSSGLDDILGGGLDADRVYLIEGRPGTMASNTTVFVSSSSTA
jgi:KaiC/GvpD/RAD55 family RecA-like ATPase